MKKYKSKIEITIQHDFDFSQLQIEKIEKLIQEQLYQLKFTYLYFVGSTFVEDFQ